MKKILIVVMAILFVSSCGLRFGDYDAYQEHKSKSKTCN